MFPNNIILNIMRSGDQKSIIKSHACRLYTLEHFYWAYTWLDLYFGPLAGPGHLP